MGGEICKAKGRERGPWYEILCLKNNIISKESKGGTDTFGRILLKSWSDYPGYQGAKEALEECDRVPSRSRDKSKN